MKNPREEVFRASHGKATYKPSIAHNMKTLQQEMCDMCDGSGEIAAMEQVWPGEPHYAPIGTQKCLCQIPDVEPEYE